MCTLAARAYASAGWSVASTSDDQYRVRNQLVCSSARPYGYVAVRMADDADRPWGSMLTRGINEAGLAFTYAAVSEAGFEECPPQDWSREMLSSAGTVGEALEHFRREAGRVVPGNYLLTDASSAAVAVEIGLEELSVREMAGDFLVCANTWRDLATGVADWASATSDGRVASGISHLTAVSTDGARSLFDLTRLHGSPPGLGGSDDRAEYGATICNHGRTAGTISAEIMEPAARRIWWTHGWPCGRRKGHEEIERRPWGRYAAFDVAAVIARELGGDLTTLDGDLTALGVLLLAELEPHQAEAGRQSSPPAERFPAAS